MDKGYFDKHMRMWFAMSQTLTISDALYSRLEAAARKRGLTNVEQLLETLPVADEDAVRFHVLAQRWKTETSHHSNISKRALHPAYQEIIGMGKAAIPLVLAELRREPDDWFWALHAITGANPVPPESRGNLRLMTDAWLQWGLAQGFKP
jgi:hypothetical protein